MTGKKRSALLLALTLSVMASGCSWMVLATSENTAEEKKTPENRLEMVQEAGTLVIGTSPDYAPFEFPVPSEDEDEPAFAGSDIELGKYIAEQLGVEAEFRGMEFEECLGAVSAGSVDLVLMGMLPLQEREEQMDFTDVYFQPGDQVLLIKERQSGNLGTAEDFEGKTIAAQYGSLQAQLVVEQFPGSCLELADNAAEAVLMLRVGSADGVVLDEALADEMLLEHPELTTADIEITYTPEGIVGGVAKGEEELLTRINEILSEVQEENMYLKWLDAANEQARAS